MECFNPSRLELARRRRGLAKGKLATEAGVTPRALTSYLRGDTRPSPKTRDALAAALTFPPAFFEGDDIEEIVPDGVSFRSLSSMTAQQQGQALGSAALALQLDDWIHARFDLPRADVPRIPDSDPERAADAVRHAWGLGERKAPNMVHLLEAHGVRVFSLVQDCLTVDAFSFWRGNIPYVFLNSNKSAEHGRMDAAHELAHLVLHAHGGPTGRAAEHEAQAFASAFLMPERSVRAALRPGLTARQIIKAKRKWNVSAMGLTHRLERLDLLSEWQARTAYIQLTNLGYRKAEPDGIEREASQILPKVFAALRSEGVSRTDVARELNVPMDEISRVTFGLTVATGADARAGAGLPPAPGPSGAKPDLHVVAS